MPEELAPAVAALAWFRWCAAVMGEPVDLELLSRLQPGVGLSPSELALHVPQEPGSGQIIHAKCPFCSEDNQLRLGKEVSEINRCPHLDLRGHQRRGPSAQGAGELSSWGPTS